MSGELEILKTCGGGGGDGGGGSREPLDTEASLCAPSVQTPYAVQCSGSGSGRRESPKEWLFAFIGVSLGWGDQGNRGAFGDRRGS